MNLWFCVLTALGSCLSEVSHELVILFIYIFIIFSWDPREDKTKSSVSQIAILWQSYAWIETSSKFIRLKLHWLVFVLEALGLTLHQQTMLCSWSYLQGLVIFNRCLWFTILIVSEFEARLSSYLANYIC